MRLLGAVAALAGLAATGCAVFGSPAGAAGPAHTAGATVATGPAGPDPAASPSRPASGARPLAGKVVGIDPGHNGLNYTDPAFLSKQIWNGREWENCNTTGTATASGYSEARFTFDVATYLAANLRAAGARVVLTRHNNHGVGPCVNRRAAIIDHSGASVAIDIHADGGP